MHSWLMERECNQMLKQCLRVFLVIFLFLVKFGNANETDLSKKIQNPMSDLTNVPFQSNFNFNNKPNARLQYNLNIQPNIPFKLSESWSVVSRTSLPINSQPVGTDDRVFGLGDTSFSLLFSVKLPGKIIWGIGPSFIFPSATNYVLGARKWGIGPAGVLLSVRGPWVLGTLINHMLSFTNDISNSDLNALLLQPFIYFNFSDGWAIGSAPDIIADWKRPSADRWIVPIGAGTTKVLKPFGHAINLGAYIYANVIHPQGGPMSQLRVSVTLLFPK